MKLTFTEELNADDIQKKLIKDSKNAEKVRKSLYLPYLKKIDLFTDLYKFQIILAVVNTLKEYNCDSIESIQLENICQFIDFCSEKVSFSCWNLLSEIVCDLYLNLGIGYRDENRKIYIDKNLDLPATLSEEDLDALNSNARILVVTIFEDTINNRF